VTATQPASARGGDAIIPPARTLRDYAVLADGERGALLSPEGSIVWLCFPSWSSPPVFTSLLGMPGAYSIHPDGWHVWAGSYEPGTMIWRTRWTGRHGRLECRDALSFPGDTQRAVLLRRLTAVQGEWSARVGLQLAGDFGRAPLRDLHVENGAWVGRLPEGEMRWSGGEKARSDDGRTLEARVVMQAGTYHDFVLELCTTAASDGPPDAERLWQQTEAAWHSAVPDFRSTIADRDVQQSYAVLRGLTSVRTGACVAAATTSLPERADAARDYDYRFAWVRDQCFAGEAMAVLEHAPLLEDSVRFISERVLQDGPDLAPVYTTTGERVPGQDRIDITGYPGAPTVMAGNPAGSQFQLDAFGEVLLLLGAAAAVHRLDDRGRHAAEVAARAIEQRWHEPDCGIWETDARRWAHSRLVCAAGLRRMASQTSPGPTVARWLALADTITADVAANSTHPTGRWQRAPDDDRIDASLLLAQIRGAVPADDPRSRLTLQAVDAELGNDGFVYRYRKANQPLGQSEGAFLLCSFWMALASWQAGERVRASMWFERARSACGPPALFCEEYDVEQRELRGNLPQVFVHAMLMETAAAMARER
jgi:GH15 family glucan-1,4-alpha-glucosidase